MTVQLIDWNYKQLLPFTYTRSIADFRFGITTILEKWNQIADTSVITQPYLQLKYALPNPLELGCYVYAGLVPTEKLVEAISELEHNQALVHENKLLAFNGDMPQFSNLDASAIWLDPNIQKIEIGESVLGVFHVWDLFQNLHEAIEFDFKQLTKGKTSATLSETNTVLGSNVFVEEGAELECAILNSTTGPIYIGKNAKIGEGSIIRGPFAICESAELKMGAKIYGATTLGPHSKLGGEVSNSLIFGYSNKGHDGFMGNSVLGEWCNLGADTNTSNLKNNYSKVSLFNYATETIEPANIQFCGLMMGDHSKAGINTMFNTATVVGVAANIFGGDFPPKHIASFSWGGPNGFVPYNFEKACETAQAMMARRKVPFTDLDRSILAEVFRKTEKFRA